jgi:hypothetical protein
LTGTTGTTGTPGTTGTTGTTGTILLPPILRKFVSQVGTPAKDVGLDGCPNGMGIAIVVGMTEGNLGGNNQGLGDAFLASYDDQGQAEWSTQFGTSGNDKANAIVFDGQDNFYILGTTEGTLGSNNLGDQDMFVAKVFCFMVIPIVEVCNFSTMEIRNWCGFNKLVLLD